MKRHDRLMLVLGVVLAVVAFGGVLAFGSAPAQSQPQDPPTVPVVTAATDIQLGTTITSQLVTTVQRPLDGAVDTYRDASDVVGQVARRSVTAGEALTSRDFTSTGGAEAAQVIEALEPGQRAIAVPVDMVAGVGALIQAGDSVDVVLSMADSDGRFPVGVELPGFGTDPDVSEPVQPLDDFLNNTSVKVLVQDVPVLGVIEPPADTGTSTQVDPVTGLPVAGRTIAVLSVTPQEAELVRFAQLDGNVSLLLRAPGDRDTEDVPTSGVTLRTLVDQYGVLPPGAVFTELP